MVYGEKTPLVRLLMKNSQPQDGNSNLLQVASDHPVVLLLSHLFIEDASVPAVAIMITGLT